MGKENNKILEEGMKTLRRENNKIVEEGIKTLRREINKIVEEEGNKNKKGDGLERIVFRANTRPYLNEIPAHFTHAIKTKGYDVIGINAFLRKLMKG